MKLGGQPRKLRKNLVNKSDFRGQIIIVDITSQVTADETCDGKKKKKKAISLKFPKIFPAWGVLGVGNIPSPPTISTAGFVSLAMVCSICDRDM